MGSFVLRAQNPSWVELFSEKEQGPSPCIPPLDTLLRSSSMVSPRVSRRSGQNVLFSDSSGFRYPSTLLIHNSKYFFTYLQLFFLLS